VEISQKGSILYTTYALAGLPLAYHNTTSCMQGCRLLWVVMGRHFPVCLLAARPSARKGQRGLLAGTWTSFCIRCMPPIPRGENVRVLLGSWLPSRLCSCMPCMQEQQSRCNDTYITRADSTPLIDRCSYLHSLHCQLSIYSHDREYSTGIYAHC
jgi:hypothetical protein